MSKAEAERILRDEDYLPWALVQEARRVLGVKEQKAAEIMAEMLAQRRVMR